VGVGVRFEDGSKRFEHVFEIIGKEKIHEGDKLLEIVLARQKVSSFS
jgi:hypothetical protein